MKLLNRRIDAHALSGVHSVTNHGGLPAAHSGRAGVEVEDLQTVASECIHDAAVVLRLFGSHRFCTGVSVAPAAVENRPIVGQADENGDGEKRQSSPEPRDESARATHSFRLALLFTIDGRSGFEQPVHRFEKSFERKRLGEREAASGNLGLIQGFQRESEYLEIGMNIGESEQRLSSPLAPMSASIEDQQIHAAFAQLDREILGACGLRG